MKQLTQTRRLPVAMLVLVMAFCGVGPASAAAPADPALLEPFSIGGCNVRTRDRNFPTWIPQMSALGIHTVRALGGTGWSGQAERNWETLDWQVDYLSSQGVAPGGMFYNFRKGKHGLPMDDLPGFAADVGRLVTHFKGKITYWEVWNEPPNGTAPGQTAADYAKYVIAVYDAAKAADPACKIGLAAKSVAINYLDQALAAGAKGHFDTITLHPYETAGCVVDHPGTEAVYFQIAGTVRKMLAARDPAKVNCPITFTELGYAAGGRYNHGGPNTQAHALVKDYTMGIAQGIASIQWFEGRDGDSGPMGLLDMQGNPRPACTALATMIRLFSQKPQYLGWVLLNDRHYGFIFQGAAGTVLSTWASRGEPDRVDFGQPVRIVDPLTSNVTQSATCLLTLAPILVDGVPEKLVRQARANKSRPLPWGGDFTDARSVSVTYGETNVEKGLHTQSAASIAANVVAYGGSARVGTVPGGTVFMADPNFLSYTAAPIEIRAVVRRNTANAPATLKLNYESTTGYKSATPYPVPESGEWSTAAWRIDDAQFVSQWAYNFRFDPGSYCLQSVTVTRLDR